MAKGCISKSFCSSDLSLLHTLLPSSLDLSGRASCCEGDLCNKGASGTGVAGTTSSAPGTTVTLLLLLAAPLGAAVALLN